MNGVIVCLFYSSLLGVMFAQIFVVLIPHHHLKSLLGIYFCVRYFLADTLLEEITFAWPNKKGSLQMREDLASNLARALNWVFFSLFDK